MSSSSSLSSPKESSSSFSAKQQQQHSLQTLRVAQQELSSGNQSGQVFYQLSPGAVAFGVDRPVLQARVSRLIHQAIEKENTTTSSSSSS